MKKKVTISVDIPVVFMREGKQFVAFSPVLDVATSAMTFEKAKKRFEESVEIFFEEVAGKGTLDEVLQDLGWQKRDQHWEPPTIIGHETERVTIPAAA